MATLTERWLRPPRPRAQFPRYELGDPEIVGLAEARTSRVARIYHKGHEQAWDGRAVLDELIARHGGIRFPEAKRAAFGQVASLLLWGELAAWSISADLAVKLEDPPAKMAASSQVFDEARHFYVLRDYLWRAGVPVARLGGWSRRLLVELLETENLLYKVVGMQLLVETTAVVIFRQLAAAELEPVLTELLYYFERDEARHVGLGVLTLPEVLEGLSEREALALWWFQTKLQLEMIAGGMLVNPAFVELGLDPVAMNLAGFRYHEEVLRRMKATRRDRGADHRSIKGLFELSRAGQDRFLALLFPSGREARWRRTLRSTMERVAASTDRWLAARA
ncbi:MAG: ferritin-like domain-containing protein [Kofleriaceae bacterium]